MENNIALQLLAVDFKGTHFVFFGHCAIEKALIRQLELCDVSESVNWCWIKGECYTHVPYEEATFLADQSEAVNKKDDSLIRTIILTKR